MLNSHLKLKINKSKDTLNVKLEPPVGVRSFPVAQLVEHGVSNAKIMGSIPRESKS